MTDDIKELLSALMSKSEESPKPAPSMSLEEACLLYTKTHKHQVGDIVRFKKGMQHVKLPLQEQECVVVEVAKEPIVVSDPQKTLSPYFHERLDIRIGFWMPDGEFALIWFDGKRFEPVKKTKH